MKFALETKYYGPTNFKGSRIRVRFFAPAHTGAVREGDITRWMPYDYSAPVAEASQRAIASGEPAATTRPPSGPAPGPRSMTWSARRTRPRARRTRPA